jgi:hypothetical protein
MPPKRKAQNAEPKPTGQKRAAAQKVKPATMTQEEWDELRRRAAFNTQDCNMRRIASLNAQKAAADAEMYLGYGGGQAQGTPRRTSPSSPGFYEEGLSISQMRLSQMSRAFDSPDYASEIADNPTQVFPLGGATRGSNAFRYNVDLNVTPDLRRTGSTAGHVTDGTGLPRSLFPEAHAHEVFDDVPMGGDDVSFSRAHVFPCLVRRRRRRRLS